MAAGPGGRDPRAGLRLAGEPCQPQVRDRCLPEERDLSTHVVNNAMGLKSAGIWYRQSADPVERDGVRAGIETLDRYHGQATGAFSGDEHLAGGVQSQGTELCAGGGIHVLAGDAPAGARREAGWGTGSKRWPTTRSRRRSRPRCGSTSTSSRSTRSSARSPRSGSTPRTVRTRTSSAGTALRLLHGQHASGVAQIRRPPVAANG
jgi:hypothetical protein